MLQVSQFLDRCQNFVAELSDVKGSFAFASLDFSNGYWHLGLHPDFQPFIDFYTDRNVDMPTRTAQSASKSAANFQECVEP